MDPWIQDRVPKLIFRFAENEGENVISFFPNVNTLTQYFKSLK